MIILYMDYIVKMAQVLLLPLSRVLTPAPLTYYLFSSCSQPNYPFLWEDFADVHKFSRLRVLIALFISSFKCSPQL